MNIRVHVSFCIMFFSGHMPKNGIIGSYGSSVLSFLRRLHTVSSVVVSIYIPTDSARGSVFSTPSSAFIIYRVLKMAILTGVR